MADEIRNNGIPERVLEQTAGGSPYGIGTEERKLVGKYNGVIGHVYTFISSGYTFTGILLASYEKENFLFGTTRYHKVQVKCDWTNHYKEGAIIDINGDDFEMYE